MNLASVPFARALGTLVLPVAILAACSGDTASSPTPPAISTGAGATATATFQSPASAGPLPSPTHPDDTSPIVLDASLLAYLPESIDGIVVVEDADEATLALSDPALPRIASAVDGAVAVDTGTGNLVFSWIVRLRAGAFADGDYRQWRDSYDGGACAAGGGVAGNAEATIGGRQAFITTCVSGMRTYHVWLTEENILISASSIGEARFGEKLIEGVRVPE